MTTQRVLDQPHPELLADNRLARVLEDRRAALGFVVIVFAMVTLQVLANPLAVMLSGTTAWDHPLPQAALTVIVVLACAIQAAALFLSARTPAVAALLTVSVYVAVIVGLGVPTWTTSMAFVTAVAMFLLAAQRPLRTTSVYFVIVNLLAAGGLLVWAYSLGAPLALVSGYVLERALSFVAPVAGATALGMWWGVRARGVARAQAAVHEAAREQEARIETALLQERTRIAQELHDVAGQHIAGLLSLADAAIAIEIREPEQALALIEDMRTEGRFASASLYAALRDLRAVDGKQVGPTPDLTSISTLIEFWTHRGMKVACAVHEDVSDLPAVISTTAYRAVQEALTNAAKHAPGAAVAVDVVLGRESLRIAVINTAVPDRTSTVDTFGLGWGLEALSQRVHLLGGTFSAASTTERGWLVTLEVPIQDAEMSK